MAGTYPAVQLDFAPGVDASDVPAGGDWVDITSYLLGFSLKDGREDEFSQPGAGTLEVSLDNATGLFDPDNASGTYYGQLLPLVWFRLRLGTTIANTDAFYGQVSIDGWRLSASQYRANTVTVTVIDMFEQLSNTDLPGSVYELEVNADSPEAWWRLGESSGTVATDSSGNEHHGEYDGGVTFNSRTGLIEGDDDNALLIGPGRMQLPVGLPVRSDWDFTVAGWVDIPDEVTYDGTIWRQSNHGETTPGGVYSSVFVGFRAIANEAYPYVEIIVNGSAAADGAWRLASTALPVGIHRISAYIPAAGAAVPAGIVLRVDGEVVAGTTGGAIGTLPAFPSLLYTDMGSDATLDEVAIFDGDLGDVRDAAHYSAGTDPWAGEASGARVTHLLDAVDFPASLRTIATGSSTLQKAILGTDVLSALLEVAKAERGELYVDQADGGKVRFRGRQDRWTASASTTSQATFGDGGGSEVPYEAIDVQDDRIINGATMQRSNGTHMVARDAASEAIYQRRTLSEAGLLYETDAESQSRAELTVAEKKDRHRRVRSVTLAPRDDSHPAWAEVFARKIDDRVTVKWRPAYGGTYSYVSWIEGRNISYDPRTGVTATFHLSPVPYDGTGTAYWILGTSALGTDTRLGY